MIDQLVHGEEEMANWVRRSTTIRDVERLPGDASTRRYYRIKGDQKSFVLMKMESFESFGNSLPFLEIQSHLKGADVDVPEVFDSDAKRGFLLLEDLGDRTLLKRLQGVSDTDVERGIYEKVINALVKMQFHASPSQSKKPIDAFNLKFDFEKLMWEVNFTVEHFFESYLKRALSSGDRKIIDEGFSQICKTLAGQPLFFTHRDFHSRNLMVTPDVQGDRYVMIDFQDARLGPLQYDLASLLKDSYYQLEEVQIQRLLDYYIARWEALSGEVVDRTAFVRVFDFMAVQRNFKAIGSFSSFLNRRGDASYLKYIGNTFENIRRSLLKYSEFSGLREVLYNYYYF